MQFCNENRVHHWDLGSPFSDLGNIILKSNLQNKSGTSRPNNFEPSATKFNNIHIRRINVCEWSKNMQENVATLYFK